MAYIQVIRPREARGELHDAYAEGTREIGGDRGVAMSMAMWNIMQVFSLRPTYVRAITRGFVRSMWGGSLGRLTKEAIAVAVSKANRCHY